MADVFISYSRTDSKFVRALDAFLKSRGRDVWVDWEDIPPASDWQQDIYDSIDAAESFVFVVSPRSLGSEYCGKELERAEQGGKRIVPIACDAADPAAARPSLAQLNWIWCRDGDDRDGAFEKLATALETDLAWAKAHTRLLVRAVEWESRAGDGSLLLRGRDLSDAEQALVANAAKQPAPTELQHRYVGASRRGAVRRQRLLLGGVLLALAVSIALGVAALLQRNTANHRARVARAQALAAQATQALSTAPAAALADAVAAEQTERTPQASSVLRRALLANPIAYSIPDAAAGARAGGVVPRGEAIAFTGDGRFLVGLTPEGTLHRWRSATGAPAAPAVSGVGDALVGAGDTLLWTSGATIHLDAVGGERRTVRRLARGLRAITLGFAGSRPLALVAGSGTAAVVVVTTGARVRLRGPHVYASSASFSANGSRVVTQNADGTRLQVWDARTGRLLADLAGGADAALSIDGRYVATTCCPAALWSVAPTRRLANLGQPARVTFAPDGRLFVVGSTGSTRIYRAATGTPLGVLPGFGTFDPYAATSGINVSSAFDPAVAFATGHDVAVADSDGFVRLWELGSDRVVAAVAAGYANALAFSRSGLLAAMAWNGDVVVSRLTSSLAGDAGLSDEQRVFAPAFAADRARYVMPARRGAVVGSLDGTSRQLLPMPANRPAEGTLGSWAISGDGTTVAFSAVQQGGFIDTEFRSWTTVWRVGGRSPVLRLPAAASPIMLSPDGSMVAFDGKAWLTASGARVHALDGIRFLSLDGRLAVLARGPTTVVARVGARIAPTPLQGFGRLRAGDFATAAFSRDDARLLTSKDTLRLWDVGTGRPLAWLGRPQEEVDGFSFSSDGKVALVVFADRAATYDAVNGRELHSLDGAFEAISPDATLAAGAAGDGLVNVADLESGVTAAIQTDTTRPLSNVAFVRGDATLVATDPGGGLHRIVCAVCAGDDAVLALARAQLAHLPRIRKPPVGATG